MSNAKPFVDLTVEERINFFVKCQELLMKYHPESDFVIRKSNVVDRIAMAKDLVAKYKGLVYADDNICVLYNKLYMADPKDPVSALKAHTFQPPSQTYNAASIDFVVFRDLKDCAAFVRDHYDANLRHVIYIKNGKPKVYKTEKFISAIFNIPISLGI